MTSDCGAQVIAFPGSAGRKVHTRHGNSGEGRQGGQGTLTGEAFISTLRANVERAEKMLKQSAEVNEEPYAADHDEEVDGGYFCSLPDVLLESLFSKLAYDDQPAKSNATCDAKFTKTESEVVVCTKLLENIENCSTSVEVFRSDVILRDAISDNEPRRQPTTSAVAELDSASIEMPTHNRPEIVQPKDKVRTAVPTQWSESIQNQFESKQISNSIEPAKFHSPEDLSIEDTSDVLDNSLDEHFDAEVEPGQKTIASTATSSLVPSSVTLAPKSAAEQIVDNIRFVELPPQTTTTTAIQSLEQRVVRFTLQPESLGSVEVRMTMHGSGVKVQIVVESSQATREIVQAKHELQEALIDTGLSVQSIEISGLNSRSDIDSVSTFDATTESQNERNFDSFGTKQNDDSSRQRTEKIAKQDAAKIERENYEDDSSEVHSIGRRRVGLYI